MVWIIATFCAFFIKGLCGFANTLVFNTILSFTNSNISISPVELVTGYPSNVILTWRERKNLQASIFVPLSAMVLAGSLIGVFLLKNTDARMIKAVFGVVVILTGLEMITRKESAEKKKRSGLGLVFFGLLSGILCGLYGVGALLGAYISRFTESSSAFKANICAVFVIENTFRIVLYIATGILTLSVARQAFMLIPVMLAGLFAGIAAGKRLDEKIASRLIMLMLIVSGAALVVTNIL